MSEAAAAAASLEPSAAPAWVLHDPATVTLTGDWTLLSLRSRLVSFEAPLRELARDPQRHWELSEIDRLDAAGALMLWRAWGQQRPQHLRLLPEHEALIRQFSRPANPVVPHAVAWSAPIRGLGSATLGFAAQVADVLALGGQLGLDLAGLLRRPANTPWRELSANLYRTGAQALGITALVGFLVGVTLAYLTAKQLQAYGADVFLVNILGVSIPRELGPLLAAIIVAGRSGSSMTAQLGVMRVTQELDALSVMGISHTLRLVLPKVLALMLALPLVVVWTSAVMLIGGMVAAKAELGLDPVQFLRALPAAVPVANLWLGWAKAALFGAMIALLACHFGLRIRPNTESLGAGVTQSVVISITSVIVIDAMFAVLFSSVGI